MRIIHVTFSTSGGAGDIALSLQNFQSGVGFDSEIYSLTSGDIRSVLFRRPFLFSSGLLDYFLIKHPKTEGLFTLFRRGFNFRRSSLFAEGVILHIHWYPGVISLNQFMKFCKRSVPMLITLHDMHPITGGCHFSYECNNHRSKCENCPQVRKPFQRMVQRRYSRKSKIYRENPALGFTTPGPWLLEQLRISPISANIGSRLILNAVDVDVFKPRDSSKLREFHQIPSDAFVIGCCAVNIQDLRKGIEVVFRAWMSMQEEKILNREIWLVVVGGGRLQIEQLVQQNYVRFQLTRSKGDLAEIYSIFDVLCSMSSAETFPNVVHECAAMGIPSILSIIDGHAHAIGSFAIGARNECDLKDAVISLGQNSHLMHELRLNALEFARSLDLSTIHEQYAEEYARLIKTSLRLDK